MTIDFIKKSSQENNKLIRKNNPQTPQQTTPELKNINNQQNKRMENLIEDAKKSELNS